ncbi:MAG: 2-oxo-tetronate isomerase [Pseudomonadota bacterium]
MPRFAANLTMLFNDVSFLDRFEAAAAAGFEAVEFLFPYEYPAAEIRDRLNGTGLKMALFNTPPGDWSIGERGWAAVSGGEAHFEQHLERALDYASVLSPGAIHIMAGVAQGPAARAAYIESLKRACAAAPEQLFVIEPINHRDIPGYHLNRSDDAKAVIAEVGAPNLQLQLDLYHCQIMEGDLTRRIELLAPILGHVQVASVPNRREPDEGETDFTHLMATLDRVGYSGWVGCEYRPTGRTQDGLGWFAPYKT